MNVDEYTQNPLEEDGVYRGFPIAWALEPSTTKDSQSVAIAFRFALHQKWHGKEPGWSTEWPPGYFTENRTYVVKRDGSMNPNAIKNLSECGLWDGDWDKLAGPVPNVFVLLDVGISNYEGKTRYRVNWINPNADEPTVRGGFAPVDLNLLAHCRERFQSQTRAIVGGLAGTAPAPPPAAGGDLASAPGPIAVPVPVLAPSPVPVAVFVPDPLTGAVVPPAATPMAPPTYPQLPPNLTPMITPPASQSLRTPPSIDPQSDPIDPNDPPF